MGLREIAAGVEVTERQRDRGVAVVDAAAESLTERLMAYESLLPCSPEAAATAFEAYTSGTSIESAADRAGVPPVTAAKTLHLLGVDGLCPLSPQGRQIVRDFLGATLSRSDARELTGASETEFQLAVFIETHEPPTELTEAVEGTRAETERTLTDTREALDDAMTAPDQLFTQ